MSFIKPRVYLGLAVVILIMAVVVVVRSNVGRAAEGIHGDLIPKVPSASAPWVAKDMDIAGTEEMKKAVNELLNYDQALFREYTDGQRGFSLYVAYWRPRKFHPRLISHHVPDVCWVGAGWNLDESKTDYAYPVNLMKGKAWPAQYREFTTGGTRTFVLYWHVVNEKPSAYVGGPGSRSHSFFDGFLDDIKDGSGEQFFIRLSSTRPWSEWERDPLFKQVLETFAPVLTPTTD